MDNTTNYKLTQSERLCGKTKIERLFSSGSSFVVYPYRVVFIKSAQENGAPVSMFVNAPKKKFKRAVKRNLIRRRVKEAYRLNKQILTNPLSDRGISIHMAILYLEKEILEYAVLEKKMKDLLKKLASTICSEEIAPQNQES